MAHLRFDGDEVFGEDMDQDCMSDVAADAMDSDDSSDCGYTLSAREMAVIRGSQEDLPALPTKTVRIFLSSTFSDYIAERNILPRVAYPELQVFCSELGLDFQVVDMRWGVTDEVINDHQVSELCIQEIITCQQVSCGPNFVMLLGNRYGFQQFPVKIEAGLFEAYLALGREMSLPDIDMLPELFCRDENTVPPHYVLQPIHHKFRYYADMAEEVQELRAKDRASWNAVFLLLRSVLRKCASLACERGIITPQQEYEFNVSVTEEEIRQGLFKSRDPKRQVLCYLRDLIGLEDDTPNTSTAAYIDMSGACVDTNAKRMRRDLQYKRIPAALHQDNLTSYTLEWHGQGLDAEPPDEQHQIYLHQFCEEFISDMKRLILQVVEDVEDETYQRLHSLYIEVLHHARFAESKCKLFCGREAEVEKIKSYILTGQSNRPFVVFGRSGIGKTALLAWVAKQSISWMNGQGTILLRFLGTSPHSSNIKDVLESMVLQICKDRGYSLPSEEQLENVGDVRRVFWDILARTSQEPNPRSIVIVLDSCDQLSLNYGAHRMDWLPKHLPFNVRVVVSMLSDRFDCYKNMRKRFHYCNDQYLELLDLPDETANQIITSFLSQAGRCLTTEQHHLVVCAFRGNRRPLYLRLILDFAQRWQSYMPISQVVIAATIHEAITKLFEGIELKLGRIFVCHALGYLTCGRGGLTDVEMEDALSCDDEVLNTVYQYHDPPLEGVVRIPSLLWARLQHSLKEYLAQRQVDDKVVHAWYHRQFWEAAERRYLEHKQARHKILAEIFLQESGIKRTIVLKQRGNKVIVNADRCVTPQNLSARNRRKLNSLPYHLLQAGDVDTLRASCLLHFEYLLIQMLALNVGVVSRYYTEMCQEPALRDYRDIKVFKDFLELCYEALWQDPFLLAYHIQARLGKYSESCDMPLLQQLVAGANAWLASASIPLLLPSHDLELPSPDAPLKCSILLGLDGQLSPDESMVVCHWSERSAGEKLQALDLNSKSMVASIPTEKKVPFVISSDSRQVIFCDSEYAYIYELDGGDIARQFAYHDGGYEQVAVRCLGLSSDNEQLAVCVRFKKPKVAGPWQAQVYIFLLNLKSQTVTCYARSPDKKPFDALYFVDGDTKLVGLAKDRVVLMVATSLSELHRITSLPDVQTELAKVQPNIASIVVPVSYKDRICMLVYNYNTMTEKMSENIHSAQCTKAKLFGLALRGESCVVIAGTYVNGKPGTAAICIWEPSSSSYNRFELTVVGVKPPKVLAITKDQTYALIGWASGHLTVVELKEQRELWVFQAHSQAINCLISLSSGDVLSIAQDHSLKLWDACRLTEIARRNNYMNNNNSGISQPVTEYVQDSTMGLPACLNSSMQCLDLCTTPTMMMSAPGSPEQAPQFWDLASGRLLVGTTSAIQKEYEASIKTNGICFNSRTHASVHLLECGAVLYTRMRRDQIILFAIQPSSPPVTKAHITIPSAFIFVLLPPGLHDYNPDDTKSQKCLIVRDKYVEMYSLPEVKKVKVVSIPSIVQDIGNVGSGQGQRRLLRYKAGVTMDQKFFVLINRAGSVGAQSSKFFDIVDMQNETYVTRQTMAPTVPITITRDSFTYLVKTKGGEYRIYEPSKLVKELEKQSFEYRSAVHTGQFISRDGQLGVEFDNRKHVVNLWRIANMQKLHTFCGHAHQVRSCDISRDNCYFVTGSYDKTVRVWSVRTGKQLCLFHLSGAIDDVMFNALGTYLSVNCYAAPQRKKAVILRLKNIKGMRKFTRYISRYDLCT